MKITGKAVTVKVTKKLVRRVKVAVPRVRLTLPVEMANRLYNLSLYNISVPNAVAAARANGDAYGDLDRVNTRDLLDLIRRALQDAGVRG